jgi:hypothetical protein
LPAGSHVPEISLLDVMKFFINIILIVIGFAYDCNAQSQTPKPSEIFVTAGYGLAGAFFSRSYDEGTPSTLGYRSFLNKNFIGIAQEVAIGIHLKKTST